MGGIWVLHFEWQRLGAPGESGCFQLLSLGGEGAKRETLVPFGPQRSGIGGLWRESHPALPLAGLVVQWRKILRFSALLRPQGV